MPQRKAKASLMHLGSCATDSSTLPSQTKEMGKSKHRCFLRFTSPWGTVTAVFIQWILSVRTPQWKEATAGFAEVVQHHQNSEPIFLLAAVCLYPVSQSNVWAAWKTLAPATETEIFWVGSQQRHNSAWQRKMTWRVVFISTRGKLGRRNIDVSVGFWLPPQSRPPAADVESFVLWL